MLTKFPVTTDRGEYRVKVGVPYGSKKYTVKVYKRKKRSLLTPRKFKKVSDSYGDIELWGDDIVGLVTRSISDYERLMQKNQEIEIAMERAEIEFKQWNGDMTTKEDSR
ncbi:hypothetical protein M3626_20755 [Psychrobacillus sp. MER TA 17]|nr:hypothetical protein [Psychrobacillus sp. MER TA 17]